MNTKKLILARRKIDQLDNKLFHLIKKRTKIVEQMIRIKKLKKHIVDYKRINEILKKVKKKSIKNNIDHRITNRIWRSIIWSFIDFQKRNFKNK